MSRAVGIIGGVLVILLGVACLLTPLSAYAAIGWFATLALLVDGGGKIALYFDLKKAEVSDMWVLVGGICSLLLGVMLTFSEIARVAADVMIANVVSVWLIFAGAMRIVRSFRMRSVHKVLHMQVMGANWDLALVTGILMVVVGIMCLANPVIIMITLGWQIGLSLIMGGVGLITATA